MDHEGSRTVGSMMPDALLPPAAGVAVDLAAELRDAESADATGAASGELRVAKSAESVAMFFSTAVATAAALTAAPFSLACGALAEEL